MNVVRTIDELRALLKGYRASQKSIGLVPTMGFLHEGHASLIRHSKSQNEVTVVTLFVNPLQFNNLEDLDKYPRSEAADLKLLDHLKVEVVFIPNTKEIYPSPVQLSLKMGSLDQNLEGAFRPGHFSGVAVVVAKFFNIVMPDRAYFGLKDLQQFMVINQLVKDLSFPIEIVGVPIVRSESGLALSSRNARLSQEGIKTAENIHKGLMIAKSMLTESNALYPVKKAISEHFNHLSDLRVEYISIINPETFEEIETFSPSQSVAICVAAYVEGIRLIDNLYLRPDSQA